MQAARTAPVKPLVSVITTLAFPRRRPVDCLRSWTSSLPEGDLELVVVSDGGRPRLERRVAAALGPMVSIHRLPGASEMAQYDFGARASQGEWLLFTEPHVEALGDCVGELLEHVRARGLAGACVRTLPRRERSRVARMEARMYLEDTAGWTHEGDWRTFTKRGVLVARSAYLQAGGLDPAHGRYAETVLARRLHDLGHRVGYAPRARIRHQNSTDLRELLAYVWEYRRQEQAALDGPTPAWDERGWSRVAPAVIADALRVALARRRDPGWRTLAIPILRLRLALASPVAGRCVAAAAPAARCVAALARLLRPLQDDERSYADYRELWQAVGDLAVATRSRPAVDRALHGLESFHGTPFRWTAPIAPLEHDGQDPVVIELVGAREVAPDDVLVYRGAERLRPVPGESTPTRLVFGGRADGSGPVTLVCPPLLGLGPQEKRSLGLPIVAATPAPRGGRSGRGLPAR